ncbi:hypothetical protein N481_07535 [Pseudoalteromonas luteoviolacea S4047-1]|uniref:Uncharacterized protein n=1 Tax=Pseudoalteromonas luteoviolacea S4054 TaxID=1129367 RepID=A0A0F6ADF5_9GAMM|nr:hypothetical protein N479_09880 [Pseudoalteromonas luteoviolacea S4054]KZN76197.1 hypothetical protein N481_07535 [Pseudoalteromonas luteoviolacea S4047-1]
MPMAHRLPSIDLGLDYNPGLEWLGEGKATGQKENQSQAQI